MPLKLSIGLSRKEGEANYGSRGAKLPRNRRRLQRLIRVVL